MRCVALTLVLWLALATAASAQSLVVMLPAERLAEFRAAIRLELDPRVELEVVALTSSAHATVADLAHAEATRRNASRVVWIEFESGDLRPPTLYVDDIPTTGIRTHILPSAYDVLEPRVFALSLVSLLDAPGAAPAAEPTRNTEAATQPSSNGPAESLPHAPPPPRPRRRVHSRRFDGERWAMRLGGEVGMLKLTGPNAFELGVHAGISGYLAGLRIDGDYYFSTTSEQPFLFRGGVGFSYFFRDPAAFFSPLLGARLIVGVNSEQVNETRDRTALWFGTGAFFGLREHLGEHWATEQRVQADLLAGFTGTTFVGFAATLDLTVEYIF